MAQLANNTEQKYQDFIKQVIDTEEVWGLAHDDTWATSSSTDYEDTEVILFWSDKAGAQACADEEWADYTPDSISLVEFLENWCVGMYGDELLAGADWGKDLAGKESEPLVLALDVVTELKARGKTLEFTQYDSQEEFEEQLIEAMEEE